jgi:F-type H+-transporting ATPase subunit epsilon
MNQTFFGVDLNISQIEQIRFHFHFSHFLCFGKSFSSAEIFSNFPSSKKKPIPKHPNTKMVQFWRQAGMSYLQYTNLCARLVRRCIRGTETKRTQVRDTSDFTVIEWKGGKKERKGGLLLQFRL